MKIFSLTLGIVLAVSALAHADDCREKLAQQVCLYDPKRDCVPDTEARYYPKFQAAYDLLPAKLQAGLCTLKRIQVKGWMGGASAYMWFSFRASVLDQNFNLDTWATWKDQLNFGLPNDNRFTLRPDLPSVRTNLSNETPALYFVLLHELGHHLTFTTAGFDVWDEIDKRPENRFPHFWDICGYGCVKYNIPPSDIPALYRDLDRSYFISLYSAGSHYEDPPDTFAYWMMNEQYPDLEYWLELPNGDRYDVMKKLRSPRMKGKRDVIAKWYEGSKFDLTKIEMLIEMPVTE